MEMKVRGLHTPEQRAGKKPRISCQKTAEGVVGGLETRITPRKHKAAATSSYQKIGSLRIRNGKIRVKVRNN